MKIRNIIATFISFSFLISTFAIADEKKSDALRYKTAIEKILGKKGELNQENILKFSLPRNDVNVSINGVKFTPAMGLTSWVSFKKVDKTVHVAGDLILAEDQVNPVMSTALDNGLKVTSLHNHYFWESPKMMMMRIEGDGQLSAVASAIKKVILKINATRDGKGDILFANINPTETRLNTARINAIFGTKGTLKNGVYKILLGNTDSPDIKPSGDHWAAFVGSNSEAMVDGDLAISEDKLDKVLNVLRKGEIYIVSIHQQMNDDNPDIYLLHYYGIGNAEKIAKVLHAAWLISQEVS